MLISDWRSDVCASDLARFVPGPRSVDIAEAQRHRLQPERPEPGRAVPFASQLARPVWRYRVRGELLVDRRHALADGGTDRKSVVEGKRVSVRVDLGGRRNIKKKS